MIIAAKKTTTLAPGNENQRNLVIWDFRESELDTYIGNHRFEINKVYTIQERKVSVRERCGRDRKNLSWRM